MGQGVQGLTYAVDIVLCIDGTGSMDPVIDMVKAKALSFHDDLSAEMEKKSKTIDALRIKVIVFRDYYAGDREPMTESPFFALPAEKDTFKRFVDSIKAEGGGDEPENGLEAVALAIQSDWVKTSHKSRHIAVIWTDASAHPLDHPWKLAHPGKLPAFYPQDIPENFDALTDLWCGKQANTSPKRIIMYAPDASPWNEISAYWENAFHYQSQAGNGLADTDYSTILNGIANSV
ncbi:MAG: VWA domain-containing protein [Spirochaetaceae bacterium]|jgi:hypothetical protein|nr:VWA domain-containing protein [Spirochaetaceae bacterium]